MYREPIMLSKNRRVISMFWSFVKSEWEVFIKSLARREVKISSSFQSVCQVLGHVWEKFVTSTTACSIPSKTAVDESWCVVNNPESQSTQTSSLTTYTPADRSRTTSGTFRAEN